MTLPRWLRQFSLPLLVGGALVHGVGMTLKYRLELRGGHPMWWESVLFWGCYACLAGRLGIWIAAAAVA